MVRLIAFGSLGLYGVLRWGVLLQPAPTGRLLGLLGVAVLLGALGTVLARWSRVLVVVLALVAVLALFPISGVPLSWVLHMRVARSAHGIGLGLSGLPRVLVPYRGLDEWVRVVIVLGAGVLLVCSALPFAFARGNPGDLRRALGALPLVALAAVPSTLDHPRLPYLQGLVLFALLALVVWGERIGRNELMPALAACALGAAGAIVAAPALSERAPWVNYESLAGAFSPAHVETFDWTQGYGPLNWPRNGQEIFDVQAAQAGYWKTEDLDLFDGRGWVAAPVDTGFPLPEPDPAALARWTQTIKVTLRAITSSDVIASGVSAQPVGVPDVVLRGESPGTWTVGTNLGPGDSYEVTSYTPHPDGTELAASGSIPQDPSLTPYLTLTIPAGGGMGGGLVEFAPFGSSGVPVDLRDSSISAVQTIDGSPYASAYGLARRLQARSATPFAFVSNVEAWLSHGYTYDEEPPVHQYPIESFLFGDKLGYCQQFAGAMALLLRMGGVPARVATGFTSGSYDRSSHSWVVSDLDAHAWVEAWFPQYGWVDFDPTPGSDPARGGRLPASSLRGAGATRVPAGTVNKHHRAPAPTGPGTAAVHKRATGSSDTGLVIGVLALAALIATALLVLRRTGPPNADSLLAELERALARSGQRVSADLTLAALERRFAAVPEAAGYIRTLRANRFAGREDLPTLRQRRALRAGLASRLGFAGRLRALWALPPRAGMRS